MDHVNRLKKKSADSPCRFRVAAVAFDKRGDVLGYATNKPKFNRKGGGVHAEELVITKYGKKVASILICRTGKRGAILPIEPCEKCRALADKYNIKIRSISST